MFDLTKKENAVLNLFLDSPTTKFYLREVKRGVKVSPSTAKLSLDKLKKYNLIIEEPVRSVMHKTKERPVLRLCRANMENKILQEMKKIRNLGMITRSGIIDKIQNPISVVLFGSFAKGINDERSDIDLLIITNNKKPLDLLTVKGHELQIIQLTPLEWKKKVKKDEPFYHQIITTGIPLQGELPI